jgi:GT2 family glycosyltransferase
MPDLSVVLVAHNSIHDLQELLPSLSQYLDDGFASLTVADSGSADRPEPLVRRHGGRFLPGRNRGFGAGVNRAFASLGGEERYMLLVNPDVRLTGVDLRRLVADADARADVVAFAISLFDQNGHRHASLGRDPRWWHYWAKPCGFTRHTPTVSDESAYLSEHEIDWAEGSFLLIRTDAFRDVGGFDEQTFPLYAEEIDLCRRLRERGGRIVFLPGMYAEHRVADRSPDGHLYRLLIQSAFAYSAKWNGPLDVVLTRLVYVVGWTLQALLPRRERRRQREAFRNLRVAAGFARESLSG